MSRVLPVQQRETPKAARPCNQSAAKTVETPTATFHESLIQDEPVLQTQTPRLNRQRGSDPAIPPLERSHEPKLGFFPRDGGVRVGLEVPEALLANSAFHIGERTVLQPLVLGQSGEPQADHLPLLRRELGKLAEDLTPTQDRLGRRIAGLSGALFSGKVELR